METRCEITGVLPAAPARNSPRANYATADRRQPGGVATPHRVHLFGGRPTPLHHMRHSDVAEHLRRHARSIGGCSPAARALKPMRQRSWVAKPGCASLGRRAGANSRYRGLSSFRPAARRIPREGRAPARADRGRSGAAEVGNPFREARDAVCAAAREALPRRETCATQLAWYPLRIAGLVSRANVRGGESSDRNARPRQGAPGARPSRQRGSHSAVQGSRRDAPRHPAGVMPVTALNLRVSWVRPNSPWPAQLQQLEGDARSRPWRASRRARTSLARGGRPGCGRPASSSWARRLSRPRPVEDHAGEPHRPEVQRRSA